VDDEKEVASDPVLRDLIGALRQPVNLGDRAVDRAMAELRNNARRSRWLPHPGWAAALAASVALALFGTRQLQHHSGDGITFALSAPAAGRVALIGDFNDWNPDANPLQRRSSQWSVTLKLKPGRYRYSFVVDGSSWQADPHTPVAEDDFGTPTSVITVPN
jgi:hypothetical protein